MYSLIDNLSFWKKEATKYQDIFDRIGQHTSRRIDGEYREYTISLSSPCSLKEISSNAYTFSGWYSIHANPYTFPSDYKKNHINFKITIKSKEDVQKRGYLDFNFPLQTGHTAITGELYLNKEEIDTMNNLYEKDKEQFFIKLEAFSSKNNHFIIHEPSYGFFDL